MGSGTSKNQKTIRTLTIFSKLENLINQLELSLETFEKDNFTTIDELNSLQSKQNIDSLQNEINDEMIKIRQEIKKIKNKPEYDSKNKIFYTLNNKTQILYMKKEEIIKAKLIPTD